MGQCVSRKGAGALAASAVATSPPKRRQRMHHKQTQPLIEPSVDEHSSAPKRNVKYPGAAMSFGFKPRPSTAIPVIQDNTKNNTSVDTNGNGSHNVEYSEPVIETTRPVNFDRMASRLPPPKKEAAGAQRINRFGFRQNSTLKPTNKIGDIPQPISQINNNYEQNLKHQQNLKSLKNPVRVTAPVTQPVRPATADSNRNKNTAPVQSIPTKYKLQTGSLPRPQVPVKLNESKVAKQAANNSKRVAQYADESSSKEGSVNEDSGLSSSSGNQPENDILQGIEILDGSPTFGAKKYRRQRTLEMVVTGNNFDVRELDGDTVIETTVIPLPRLPSVFQTNQNTGLVRERTMEYQRQIEKDRRKVSTTSSEGFHEDCDEEKAYRDRARTEKILKNSMHDSSIMNTSIQSMSSSSYLLGNSMKSSVGEIDCPANQPRNAMYSSTNQILVHPVTQLVNNTRQVKNSTSDLNGPPKNSPLQNSMFNCVTTSTNSSTMHQSIDSGKQVSPASSDDQEWGHAGEAMADEYNYSFSSSDESKEKDSSPVAAITNSFSSKIENFVSASMRGAVPKQPRNVLLTIEDPKFAAVAAASSGNLLEDETSPVDSLVSSMTESNSDEIAHKAKDGKEKSGKMNESTNSKDLCDRSSPTTPGTPTNASNSLSLSDGKDFFDDEIADQPGLVFDDTQTAGSSGDVISVTDNTPTMKDIEQKPPAGRVLGHPDGSPAPRRAKLPLLHRTGSVDTLSPCESIASDDLMMDFDQSQSSGFDDSTDRLDAKEEGGLHSLDEITLLSELESQREEIRQEWSSLLKKRKNREQTQSPSVSLSGRTTRLHLRSRAAAAGSSVVPDSPRSLDNSGSRSRVSSTTHSPMRLARQHLPPNSPSHSAYDSDDSIRVDRQTHGSMMQDIVGMKTMLLKLKRVLQESETLNPFENSPVKNGHFNGVHSSEADSDNQTDSSLVGERIDRFELADLRRQVVFLQAQLEDRERTVQQLRRQVAEGTSSSAPTSICESSAEMCNAATQTERIRPMSAGPSLLHGFPTDANKGPLVSTNEAMKKRRPPSLVEFHPSMTNALTDGSPTKPTTLLRVFKKQTDVSRPSPVPNTTSILQQHTVVSSIPRRSHSHGRLRLTQIS